MNDTIIIHKNRSINAVMKWLKTVSQPVHLFLWYNAMSGELPSQCYFVFLWKTMTRS